MSNVKQYPSHRLTFSEQRVDGQGQVSYGAPMTVGAVWDRKHGKQGGILKPDIPFDLLGEGQYRLEENRPQGVSPALHEAKTHRISFSAKQAAATGTGSQLGRPVDVATVQENGNINWSLSPNRLNDGVLFVLENERQNQQGQPDKLDKVTEQNPQKQQGVAR